MTAAIARSCFRHRVVVLLVTAVLLALSAFVLPDLGRSLQSAGLVTIDGSQSAAVAEIQHRDFQLSYEIANVVFTSDKLRATDSEYQKMVVATTRLLTTEYPYLFGVPTVPYGNKLLEKALIGRDHRTAMARLAVYGRPTHVPDRLESAETLLDRLSEGRLPTDLKQPAAAAAMSEAGKAADYGTFLESLKKLQADTGIKAHLLSPTLASDQVTGTAGDGVKTAIMWAIVPVVVLLLLAVGYGGGLVPVLVTPLVTLVLSLGAVTLLGQVVTLNVFGVGTLALISFGLGLDVALYAYSRYKAEADGAETREEAIGITGATSIRAIVGGSLVAALALVPMILMPAMTYRSFAIAGIVTLVILAAVGLFFLPAFLGLCGGLAFAGKLPWHDEGSDAGQWRLAKVVGAIMRRPRTMGAVAIVIGVLCALPALKILPATGTTDLLPPDASQAVAAESVQKAFDTGVITTAWVVVDANADILRSVPTYEKAIDLERRIAADKDTYAVFGPADYIATVAAVAPVGGPEVNKALAALRDRDIGALEKLLAPSPDTPQKSPTKAEERADQLESADFALDALPGVGATLRGVIDGAGYMLTVMPKPGANSQAANRYVERLRRYAGAEYAEYGPHVFTPGGHALVGGMVAQGVDASRATRRWLPGVLALMGLVVLLALTLLLRSFLGALLAVLAEFLVVFGAFGTLVAMFQWGWLGYPKTGFVEAEVPMLLLPVLVASLTVHLSLWLFRIREIPPDATARREFLVVVTKVARVGFVGSAVLFVLFAFTARSDSVFLAQMGVGLCAMIALDFLLVRLLLIPAAVGRFGRRLWWLPGPVNRHLPGPTYVPPPE